MDKNIIILKVLIMTITLSCVIIVSCKNPGSGKDQKTTFEDEVVAMREQLDTLESGVICYSVGSYTVIDYSYVSPSTVKRYAYDYLGRKVYEDGCTYSGSYSLAVWDYAENGQLKKIYIGDTFEHTACEYDEDGGLFMLVSHLTDCTLSDPAIINYVFEYNPNGHIRRVYNPNDNNEIVCPEGGEITFRVYAMDGDDTSKLIGNNAINIEFRVREPQTDSVWNETIYIGYSMVGLKVIK